MIIAVRFATFAVSKRKPEKKKKGLNGIIFQAFFKQLQKYITAMIILHLTIMIMMMIILIIMRRMMIMMMTVIIITIRDGPLEK